jgi:hypothetical protein
MLLEAAGPWETIAREKGIPLAYTSCLYLRYTEKGIPKGIPLAYTSLRQLYKVALPYFCKVASKVALHLKLAKLLVRNGC